MSEGFGSRAIFPNIFAVFFPVGIPSRTDNMSYLTPNINLHTRPHHLGLEHQAVFGFVFKNFQKILCFWKLTKPLSDSCQLDPEKDPKSSISCDMIGRGLQYVGNSLGAWHRPRGYDQQVRRCSCGFGRRQNVHFRGMAKDGCVNSTSKSQK